MINQRNVFILIIVIVVIWGGSLVISKILVSDKNPSQRYSGEILGSEGDSVLKRVCFNCHSNETQWPWYTSMPVIAVLVSSDVSEAREHLNFSNWESIPVNKREFYLELVFDEIEEDAMPPFIYKLGHPEAKLNKDDLDILMDSANSLGIPFSP